MCVYLILLSLAVQCACTLACSTGVLLSAKLSSLAKVPGLCHWEPLGSQRKEPCDASKLGLTAPQVLFAGAGNPSPLLLSSWLLLRV